MLVTIHADGGRRAEGILDPCDLRPVLGLELSAQGIALRSRAEHKLHEGLDKRQMQVSAQIEQIGDVPGVGQRRTFHRVQMHRDQTGTGFADLANGVLEGVAVGDHTHA